MTVKKIGGVKLEDWFEWLALNALGPDVYYSNDNKEIARLLLEKLENCPERSWGWSWVSIFHSFYHDIEPWEKLSLRKKEQLVDLMFDYLERLAEN
jgi:hypothetical protein